MSYVIDLRVQNLSPRPSPPAKQFKFKLKLPAFEWRQPLHWLLVGVIMLGIVAPVAELMLANARYDLKTSSSLLGSVNNKMAAKISYDDKAQLYQFNKEGKTAKPAAGDHTTVGATGPDANKLYSADLPVDSSKGVTIYDNLNNLSVGFVPQFRTLDGKQQADRIVYPVEAHAPQLVYTTKANGLKEDIILPQYAGDKQSFSYKLNLAAELEAKLLPSGAVGVYSADPTLFGNISFGSDADQQKVQAARKNGAKTNLVFAIPAPLIKQTGKGSGNPTAKFTLDGNILTVTATGLKKASYPLSVDPSLVVTSSSDFTKGNNEGIDFDLTNNQILRPGLTGGTVGAWDGFSTASVNTARQGYVVATYNGYIYAATGTGASSSALTSVEYAALSNGTIGTWQTTTAVPASRNLASGVIYDGYFYIGGGTISSVNSATVIYALVNADGTLGAWNTTSSMTTARQSFKMVAYNSHLYAAAGCVAAACTSGSTATQSVENVTVKADGTLGSWTTTTAFTLSARTGIGAAIYNGYFYVAGGLEGVNTEKADGQYAPINADGTVGTWHAIGNLSVARQHITLVVANGYAYAIGGSVGLNSQTTVEYAAINSDGSLGSWTQTSALSLGRHLGGGVAVGGYIYMVSGFVNGNLSATTTSTKIDPAGVLGSSSWNVSGNQLSALRTQSSGLAYNGYLYAIGGCNGAGCLSPTNTIEYAAINSDGTVGTWATTGQSLSAVRTRPMVVADNSYLYVIGGCNGSGATTCTGRNTTDIFPINSAGTLGSITTDSTHTLSTARGMAGYAFYNGYVYIAGGCNGTCASTGALNSVEYTTLSSGTLGSWTTDTHNLSSSRSVPRLAAYNGKLYITGGAVSGTGVTTVEAATIGSSGALTTSWSSTGLAQLTNARGAHAFGIYNGYAYVVGGALDNSTALTSVEYAKVDSTGSIASWSSTVDLNTASTAPVANGGYAFVSGAVYIIAGNDSASAQSKNVAYEYINNGGSGATSSWSTDSTNPPVSRKEFGAVAYNGYVYISGGCADTVGTCANVLNSTQYAPINDDGSLGTWSTYGNFTPSNGSGLYRHAMVINNGYLYILGGQNTTTIVNDVLYSKIASGGGADTTPCGTAWCTTNTFSTARRGHAAVVANGRIYISGGLSSAGSLLSDVQYAVPNANGTIPSSGTGSWTSTTSFNTARYIHASVAYNGYLYILGGCSNTAGGCTGGALNDVQFALLDSSSGAISGSWNTANVFDGVRYQPTVAAYGGYIYIMGGIASGTYKADVQYASIGVGGIIGTWQKTTSLTTARFGQSSFVNNGVVYCLEGQSSTPTVLSSVEYASLQTIPRIGHYSRLLDSDLDVMPTKLIANGVTGGVDTALNFSYQSATSSTPTLGSLQSGSLVLGTPTSTITTVSGGLARYYFLNFSLDDSHSAIFPDSASNQTTLTDFTLYYHPATAKRLRGGKTFTGQTQQSLDASP